MYLAWRTHVAYKITNNSGCEDVHPPAEVMRRGRMVCRRVLRLLGILGGKGAKAHSPYENGAGRSGHTRWQNVIVNEARPVQLASFGGVFTCNE